MAHMSIRTDSKSISLLAVFTAMVVAMEAVSIPFVTDIRVVGSFSIDWTGIVIMVVFLGLGFVFSLVTIAVMWASIAYRSITSATFKGVAEFLTLLGVLLAAQVIRGRNLSRLKEIAVYVVFACFFRALGMYFANIALPIFFYGIPVEVAIGTSLLYLPWNVVQALINIVGGWLIFNAIPRELAVEAALGEYRDIQKSQELTDQEDAGFNIE